MIITVRIAEVTNQLLRIPERLPPMVVTRIPLMMMRYWITAVMWALVPLVLRLRSITLYSILPIHVVACGRLHSGVGPYPSGSSPLPR